MKVCTQSAPFSITVVTLLNIAELTAKRLCFSITSYTSLPIGVFLKDKPIEVDSGVIEVTLAEERDFRLFLYITENFPKLYTIRLRSISERLSRI